MPSRPDSAAVVEQALADVLPHCMRPERLHRVEPLDLDTAEASIAFDPEQFAGISESRRCWIRINGLPAARGSRRRASQCSWGNGASGGGIVDSGVCSGLLASFSICAAGPPIKIDKAIKKRELR
jgi:hypothetical protein